MLALLSAASIPTGSFDRAKRNTTRSKHDAGVRSRLAVLWARWKDLEKSRAWGLRNISASIIRFSKKRKGQESTPQEARLPGPVIPPLVRSEPQSVFKLAAVSRRAAGPVEKTPNPPHPPPTRPRFMEDGGRPSLLSRSSRSWRPGPPSPVVPALGRLAGLS